MVREVKGIEKVSMLGAGRGAREVRCFIDAIFGHSLGSGVSTRAGRGPSSPHYFRGSSRWCVVLLMRKRENVSCGKNKTTGEALVPVP